MCDINNTGIINTNHSGNNNSGEEFRGNFNDKKSTGDPRWLIVLLADSIPASVDQGIWMKRKKFPLHPTIPPSILIWSTNFRAMTKAR